MRWQPISELEYQSTGHVKHGLNMLVHAPELVDLDCNPLGIAEAYWQDDGKDGTTVPGAFLAAKYCMYHDEWHVAEVKPTHFMYVHAPSDSVIVGIAERMIADQSRKGTDRRGQGRMERNI